MGLAQRTTQTVELLHAHHDVDQKSRTLLADARPPHPGPWAPSAAEMRRAAAALIRGASHLARIDGVPSSPRLVELVDQVRGAAGGASSSPHEMRPIARWKRTRLHESPIARGDAKAGCGGRICAVAQATDQTPGRVREPSMGPPRLVQLTPSHGGVSSMSRPRSAGQTPREARCGNPPTLCVAGPFRPWSRARPHAQSQTPGRRSHLERQRACTASEMATAST